MFDYFATHTLKGWGAMSPLKSLRRMIGDEYGLYREENEDVSPEDFANEISNMKEALFKDKN